MCAVVRCCLIDRWRISTWVGQIGRGEGEGEGVRRAGAHARRCDVCGQRAYFTLADGNGVCLTGEGYEARRSAGYPCGLLLRFDRGRFVYHAM